MNCSCWHLVGGLFWAAAFLCLIFAWVGTSKGGAFSGVEVNTWYLNALVLGVLAVPLKLKGHGEGCACGVCK